MEPIAVHLPLRRGHAVLAAILCAGGCAALLHSAEPPTLTIRADQPGAAISPTMWGVFFEDINYGADGGLYPERVENRSFEFPDPLMGWHEAKETGATGVLVVTSQSPAREASPHYLQLHASSGGFGVENEGFFGMGVQAGESYRFSAVTRAPGASVICACGKRHWSLVPAPLRIELIGQNGDLLARARMTGFGPAWKQKSVLLRAKATDAKARLRLTLEQMGEIHLDSVSLLPTKTFKGHGLRADMVQKLADLKPGFVRFPGGCIVEGHYLSTRYQWKTTVGPRDDRKLIINRWNDEFKHRPAPDYFQSFGLGFFEYFQMCEDIGAEPLPILNCGMACQFNSGELVPLDQLQPYIQDALDLIEFANGSVTGEWGAKRAAMGHPAPFNMKLLGVGNEQWLQPYLDRYALFARALKARHPEIQLISSAGPGPDDDKFHFAWPKLRELNADIVDEHCYANPGWFFENAHRYDDRARTGPKAFMGEYAAQSVKTVSPDNRNDWECALSEAAYLTGLERNADVVVMASYAPLFAHVEGWQWTPNLIWCDNLRSFGTPNYYVQQLFSRNRGTRVLPVRASVDSGKGREELFCSAARDERTGEVIVKLVNGTATARPVRLQLAGVRAGEGTRTVLASADLKAENSLDQPTRVAPKTTKLPRAAGEMTETLAPYSLTVLRIAAKP